ncbi:hypothetical protein RSOLAG22IIIB_00475 [Rhizoctonia solani]|uniref:DUF7923 domain-containing protein n=1 Tax=Rhizoctonia solani TaxID=456999 RepID=A0A0K6FVU4_9AGAM|nr:hypothetical protein RSOLAG22IIIB_00475 [Rhizoctonia solani]
MAKPPSQMSETVPYTSGRYSTTTEHRYAPTLSTPAANRGRTASSASGTPGSPGPVTTTGADTCEDLLFKVIARVQGMKMERESLTSNIDDLHAQIERLESTVAEQKRKIEEQGAQIERLNQAQSRLLDTYAICLVDGDGYIFDKRFLVNGYEGGREAAASLTKQLHQDLGNASISLWTCVYYNHSGLKKVLSKAQIVSEATFDEFCDGFRSASQLIHMMDVGRRKEAADEKIKEMLRVFATAPQTKIVYFGGGHDSGYAGALSHYQNLGLETKIVILKGYDEIAYDLRNFPFRIMDTDGLFMSDKVDPDAQVDGQAQAGPHANARGISSNRTTPPTATSYALAATLTAPLSSINNRSPSPGHVRRISRDAGRNGQRRIDTSKVGQMKSTTRDPDQPLIHTHNFPFNSFTALAQA